MALKVNRKEDKANSTNMVSFIPHASEIWEAVEKANTRHSKKSESQQSEINEQSQEILRLRREVEELKAIVSGKNFEKNSSDEEATEEEDKEEDVVNIVEDNETHFEEPNEVKEIKQTIDEKRESFKNEELTKEQKNKILQEIGELKIKASKILRNLKNNDDNDNKGEVKEKMDKTNAADNKLEQNLVEKINVEELLKEFESFDETTAAKMSEEELEQAKDCAERLKGVSKITNPHAFCRWVVQQKKGKWQKYLKTLLAESEEEIKKEEIKEEEESEEEEITAEKIVAEFEEFEKTAAKTKKLTEEELAKAKDCAERLKDVKGITNPHAFCRWIVQQGKDKWQKYLKTLLKKKAEGEQIVLKEYATKFFEIKDPRSESYWIVYEDEEPIYKITAREASTDDDNNIKVIENWEWFKSKEYGELLKKAAQDGIDILEERLKRVGKRIEADGDEEGEGESLVPPKEVIDQIEEESEEPQKSLTSILIDFLAKLVIDDHFTQNEIISQVESNIISEDNWQAFQGALSQKIEDLKSGTKEEAIEEEKTEEKEEEIKIEIPLKEATTKGLDLIRKCFLKEADEAQSLKEIIAFYTELGLDPAYLKEFADVVRKTIAENKILKEERSMRFRLARAKKLVEELVKQGKIEQEKIAEKVDEIMKLDDKSFDSFVKLVQELPTVKAKELTRTASRDAVLMTSDLTNIPQFERRASSSIDEEEISKMWTQAPNISELLKNLSFRKASKTK